MFSIKSVYRNCPELVTVMVTIDSRAWNDFRKNGHLGQLYGIDISNEVYRTYGVKAHNPTVNESIKVKTGTTTKIIELTYADSEWVEKMGELIHVDFVAKKRVA
jgi:hypothetical protein